MILAFQKSFSLASTFACNATPLLHTQEVTGSSPVAPTTFPFKRKGLRESSIRHASPLTPCGSTNLDTAKSLPSHPLAGGLR